MSPPKIQNDRFWTTCPTGHSLPHRTNRGRCTPDECCHRPGDAVSVIRDAHKMNQKTAAELTAFSEETERLLDARGRMAAWDQQHPLPKLATAPTVKPSQSVYQYLRERTAQAAPLALERIIRKALLVPGAAGDAAADNILDRMGFTRRGEAPVEFNGPVQIVNLDPSRIPLLSQKADVEGQITRRQGEEHVQVHGDTEEDDDVGDAGGDDRA